jgi:hypothetical protein
MNTADDRHSMTVNAIPTKLGCIQVISTDRVFMSRPGMRITGRAIGISLAAQKRTRK